jgi:hypothetical protein
MFIIKPIECGKCLHCLPNRQRCELSELKIGN